VIFNIIILFYFISLTKIKKMMNNAALEPGMEILDGRYKILSKMGTGAFAEVYKGKYR